MVMNREEVMTNPGELIKLFSAKALDGEWTKLRESMARAHPHRARHFRAISNATFIKEMVAHIQNDGTVIQDNDTNRNPGFRYGNTRILHFVLQHARKNKQFGRRLEPFLQLKASALIHDYIRAATRRAEYSRRYGYNGERIALYQKRAEREGASKEDIQLSSDMIDANNGMYGSRTKAAINKMIKNSWWLSDAAKKRWIDAGSGVVHQRLTNYNSVLLTYTHYRTLTTQIFSNFIEPLGVMVQTGGDIPMSLRSIGYGMANALRSWNTMKGYLEMASEGDLVALANTLGTINNANSSDLVMETYSLHHMGPFTTKLNNWFFRVTGIDFFTHFTRLVSTTAANHFMVKHSQRPNNVTSRRYMEELGLLPGDITDDMIVNGVIRVLSQEQINAAMKADATKEQREAAARDERIRYAFHMFVDWASNRPGAHNRPMIFNDPHYAAITHLKGYTMAFHENILRRVGTELTEHHNAMPLIAMIAFFIPVMMLAEWLRDRLKYGSEVATWKKDWSDTDHLFYAIRRAGFWGKHEFLMSAARDFSAGEYSRGVADVLGPTAGHIRKLSKYGVSTADLPFQDLWRNWITDDYDGDEKRTDGEQYDGFPGNGFAFAG
jgi:hypothetical protein